MGDNSTNSGPDLPRTGVAVDAAAARWRRFTAAGRTKDADHLAGEIVEALLPMIHSLVRGFIGPGKLPLEDAVQAGRVAITSALGRYNPDCGATFKTFAHTAVAGGIRNYFRDTSKGNIKEPRHLIDSRKVVELALETLPPDSTIEDIAAAAGIPARTVSTVLKSVNVVQPTKSLTEIDPDQCVIAGPDWVGAADARMLIEQYLPRLSDMERIVINRRFFDGDTFEEIAQDLKISRERTRQIQTRAMQKLRTCIEGGT